MTFRLVLNIIISAFFVLGAVDYLIGDKFGFGGEFSKAFSFIGRVALTIVGMISLAPVLADILTPVVKPVYNFLGLDPAMFITLVLPPDSGAYDIAMNLANDPAIGKWAGTVCAAHLGACIAFNIPTCLGMIDPIHHRHFSLGALSGIIACPFGCILGGIICRIPVVVVLYNLIPTILISVIIALGLIRPEKWSAIGYC